jgi:catechol 2,3-dioxygenase-like lactoylglutathione lyase family enzyme
MEVKALNHVALVVDDLDKAKEFYGGLLELEELDRPPEVKGGVAGAWYELGDRQLHLMVMADDAKSSAQHFAIEIDGMDALVKKLNADGFEVEDSFGFGDFNRRKFTRDPSGNRIELMSKN